MAYRAARKYVCDRCGMEFYSIAQLEVHRARQHGQIS